MNKIMYLGSSKFEEKVTFCPLIFLKIFTSMVGDLIIQRFWLLPGDKVRLCGDFKVTLNPALKTNVYLFPLLEELSHKLNGGHKFSKLDLAETYLQIPLDEKFSELAVINTHQVLYKYKYLPFRLSCSPATFQKLIEQIVSDIATRCGLLSWWHCGNRWMWTRALR